MSAYRDELEALRTRAEAAERELARLRARSAPNAAPSGLSLVVAPEDCLLWYGRPVVSRLVLRWLPLSALGVLWLLFFIGVVGASFAAPRVLLAPFAAIGVWLFLYPLREARRAAGVRYAVTHREAIVVRPGTLTSSLEVRSFQRFQLGHLKIRRHAHGGGDIVFEGAPPASSPAGRRAAEVGFLALADLGPAEQALRTLLHADDGAERNTAEPPPRRTAPG